MHVLVITNDLPPQVGGIQYYVDQLARGLVAAGDEVTVYGSTSSGWEEFDESAPYRVVREPTHTLLPTPTVARHALALIERWRPDVIVFGAAFPLGLLGRRLRARTGIPYIGFTHGLEVSTVRAPEDLDSCARSVVTHRRSHSYRAGAGTFCNRLSVQAPATNCCRLRSTPPSTPESTAHGSGRDTASVKTPWSSAFRVWSNARVRIS